MISYNIKEKIERHKILIANFNFLSIFQLAQLLLPLITYTYLIRILGKELFGVIVFAGAIAAYFILFINFGFNIAEIKEISVGRHDKNKVSEIISSVLTIKFSFALISIVTLICLVVFFDFFRKYHYLYLAYMCLLIDAAINPNFYFQGIEKMKFITILSLISQFFFTLLIFVIIKRPSQYILVPLFLSLGSLMESLAGLFIIFKKHQISFIFLPFNTLKKYLLESLPFFTSRLSVVFNQKTNVLLIGSFLGYNEIAYYDLAEKITNVMKIPFNILNQALYPNVSVTKNISLVKKVLKILILIYVLNYFSIYLWGKQAILLLGTEKLLPALKVLYIFGLTAITDLIVVFLGAPLLLISGFKKEFNLSLVYGSLFYLILVSILYLAKFIGLYQLVICSLLSSCYVLFYRAYYSRKFNLL